MNTIVAEQSPASLQARLAPAEQLFFSWLTRVFLTATLVASAWIDDAPPLELAAAIIAVYVGVRVLAEYTSFAAAAPFTNPVLRGGCAVLQIALLALSFAVVVTLIGRLSLLVA